MFSRCVLHLRNPQLDCVWINLVIFGYIFTYHTFEKSELDYFFNWFGDIFTYFHLKSILDLIVLEIIWCCGRGQQKPQVVLPRQSTKKKSICSLFYFYLSFWCCVFAFVLPRQSTKQKSICSLFFIYICPFHVVYLHLCSPNNQQRRIQFVRSECICPVWSFYLCLLLFWRQTDWIIFWWRRRRWRWCERDSCLLGKLSCLVLSPCCEDITFLCPKYTLCFLF